MEIEVSDHDGVLAIAPQGRLDSNSAPELEELLLGRIESGNTKMIVDFSAIHYVSSAGLRVLLMAAKRTRAANGSFALAGATVRSSIRPPRTRRCSVSAAAA